MNFLPNITIKQVQGLEWFETPDSNNRFSICLLNKNRNNIDLVEQHEVGTYDLLFENLNPSIPVVLNFSGKGVLSKIIPGVVDASEQTLQMILPHADLKDFYMQISSFRNNSLVSILRRTKVDEILTQLKDKKIRVIDLMIGPQSLFGLQSAMEENTISNRNNSLSFSPILSLDKNENEIKPFSFGDQSVNEKQVSALGSAWSVWFPLEETKTIFPSNIEGQLEEEKHRRLFKMTGVFALAVFFLAMAINLFVYQNLSKEVATLQQKTFMNKGFLIQMDSMNNELTLKEQLTESTGIKNQSRITFFADKIAALVPLDIKLNIMAINENTKKMKSGKRVAFIDNEIRLTGNSKTTSELNNWINQLEELDFTNYVSLTNYIGSGRKKGDFEINIVVN